VGFGFSLGELERMELTEAAHWSAAVGMYRATRPGVESD
jgi:hypothetical protein